MGRRIGALGLVNYRVHPVNKQYRVFGFYTTEEADSFRRELEKRQVWYDADQEQVKQETLYLIGVHQSDFKKAQQANFTVAARHRTPIIKNRWIGVALIIAVVGLLVIGMIGYIKD